MPKNHGRQIVTADIEAIEAIVETATVTVDVMAAETVTGIGNGGIEVVIEPGDTKMLMVMK